MRRYVIACEFYNPKRAIPAGECIRKFAAKWHHLLAGTWIVETPLSAEDIRIALLSCLDVKDRVYIVEAGAASAEFNTRADSGSKITQIEDVRTRSRILASIFSRNGRGSRHLTAATSKNLKSA